LALRGQYAVLGELAGTFVFVVSQQFDDAFLVWGGSIKLATALSCDAGTVGGIEDMVYRKYVLEKGKGAYGMGVIGERYPQTSLMRDRTAFVFCERAPRRREGRGAISRRRVTCPLFMPTAIPTQRISFCSPNTHRKMKRKSANLP